MKFGGFLLAVVALAWCTCRCQGQQNPSQFDVDGVRLGMSVDEAYSALQTYGFKYIAKAQFGSRLGKGPFIGAIVGMTGTEYSYAQQNAGNDLGDHVSVLFTETEGKAYSIDRTVRYGYQTSTSWDVLRQRVIEKYGNPTPTPNPPDPRPGTEYWVYDPGGRPISGPWNAMISNYSSRRNLWSYCATQYMPGGGDTIKNGHLFYDDTPGQILGNRGGGTADAIWGPLPYHVPEKAGFPSLNRHEWPLYSPMSGWSQPGVGLGPIHAFSSVCGVTLRIHYMWGPGPGVTVQAFEVSLFDNQLASKNIVKLIEYANGVRARQIEENRKKSEQQKPF